jgi:hypothetical protein
METDLYSRATSLAVNARALLSEIERLGITRPAEEPNPWAQVLTGAVERALDTSGLEAALREFEASIYAHLPDVRGEHDYTLRVRELATGFVRFHGSLEDGVYEDLREMAKAAGFDWREYQVGIGAAGVAILVSFGTSLAATAVYEFLVKLTQRQLAPEIDAVAAVELSKLDVMSRWGSSIVFDSAFAKPSPVRHAKYEVYLHPAGDERVFVLLVRPNGEVCGRKEGRLRLVSERG